MASPSCVVSYLLGERQTLILPGSVRSHQELCLFIRQKQGVSQRLVLQCEGRILSPDGEGLIPHSSTVVATLPLPGGKGGFGSMLRAIGAQIEKTTNKEACRDLSGRRLRDINKEKVLKEQLQKRADKERERMENRKKKFAALKEEPKHVFNDSSFYKENEQISQALFDSVEKGLKVAAADESTGRGAAESGPSTSSGCSSGSDSNETAPPKQDGVEGKGVKRKQSNESTKLAKRSRMFDDLDDSSDDSDVCN